MTADDMPSQKYPVLAYDLWTDNPPESRWLNAANTFGIHLMRQVYDQAQARIPSDISDQVRIVAEQAIRDTLHAMMDFLDGYARSQIDSSHRAEYVLLQRIYSEQELLETLELTPEGDGLAMGLAGWLEGDFGQARKGST